MKVSNMISPRSGRAVANQFLIEFKNGELFQSYESKIAFIPKDRDIIYLGLEWDYSPTTGKYRNQFLGMDKKELERRIKDGTAIIVKDWDNPPKKIKKVEVGMKLKQVTRGNLTEENFEKYKKIVITVETVTLGGNGIWFKNNDNGFYNSCYSEDYLIKHFVEVV